MMTKLTEAQAKEMLEYKLEFGKHKGTSIQDLIEKLPGYAMWLVGQGESGNPSFAKAQVYIKQVMEWGEDGPDLSDGGIGVYAPAAPTLKTHFPAKDESFLYTWVSKHCDGTDDFNFCTSEDNLQYCMLVEKWKTYDHDYFVIVQRTPAGDFLAKHMEREVVDFAKGKFLNVAA